jgi:hypothetical protein
MTAARRPWNHGRYGVCVGDTVTDSDGAIVRDTLDERVIDRDRVDDTVTDGVTDGMKIVAPKK